MLQYILIITISSLVLIGGIANYYVPAQADDYAEDDANLRQDGFLKGIDIFNENEIKKYRSFFDKNLHLYQYYLV